MPDPVSTATSYLGTPYVYGGNTCNGLDCSGLVKQAYPNLPRTAHEQYSATQRLSDVTQLQKGDLVFLHGTQKGLGPNDASHVGIYDGAGNVIHASSAKGKVISVPLSQFTASKNFFGFGRPGTSSMPKPPTKAAGLATQPQTAPAPANLSGVTDADGNLDPSAFLAAALSQRQGGADLPFYTPYAPVQHTTFNPWYDPSNPDMGPQSFAWTTPSLADQRNQAEQDALKNQVTPAEQEQARLKSIANLYKAQADVIKNHPTPQYNVPDLPPLPERQYADIPNRPAPGFDPLSSGLAALAGLVDPQRAGQYGTAPMQAAMGVADQQYQDRLRNYELATQQLNQQYQDAMTGYNANVAHNQQVAAAQYQNAMAANQQGLQSGNLDALSGNSTEQANTLGGFIPREQAAAKSALDAQQASRTIGEQLQQNAATTQYNLGQQQRDNQVLRDLLNYGRGVYGSQQKLQGTEDTNESHEKIGAAHDKSREAAAKTRADALVQAATVRANAVGNKIHTDVSKLPPQVRDQIQRLGQVWANSEKEVTHAYRDAEKAFSTDLKADPSKHDEYLQNYVQPFAVRAAGYQQQYEQALQNAAKSVPAPPPVKGKGNPAPAPRQAPPAGQNPAPRPNTLPPGFSNVRIVPAHP